MFWGAANWPKAYGCIYKSFHCEHSWFFEWIYEKCRIEIRSIRFTITNYWSIVADCWSQGIQFSLINIQSRCQCPFDIELLTQYQMTFQIASIPDVVDTKDQSKKPTNKNECQLPATVAEIEPSSSNINVEKDSQKVTETVKNESEPKESVDVPDNTVDGVKACEDARYRKFFKMIQFGVPPPAAKLKMNVEGLDPNVLE